MKSEFQLRSDKLTVLIDADNANPNLIEPLLREIAKYGTAHVKRIYGDWTSPQLSKWKSKLNEFAIQPVQQFCYTTGKNATDSSLIIDAMDLLYTQGFDGFCIVSSDSDFTRLASRVRESGLTVYGFGEKKKTPKAFISACDKFIFTEFLEHQDDYEVSSSSKTKPEEAGSLLEKSTSSLVVDKDVDSQKSKLNVELIPLLKDAYDAVAEEDGWANLGPFGAQLTKLSPSFDPRTYGYKQLGQLVRARSDLFEVRETPHPKNPVVKDLYIKLQA